MEIIDTENPQEAITKIMQSVKGSTVQGLQKAEQSLNQVNLIVCQVVRDWVKPYTQDNRPVVIFSTHPRFVTGTRMDWGFFGIAIDEGYNVFCLAGKPTGIWSNGTLKNELGAKTQ